MNQSRPGIGFERTTDSLAWLGSPFSHGTSTGYDDTDVFSPDPDTRREQVKKEEKPFPHGLGLLSTMKILVAWGAANPYVVHRGRGRPAGGHSSLSFLGVAWISADH